MAFLLIRTSKEARSGAKQAVLERFLGQLRSRGVQPEFTLTDKDWSEINAMRATWPEAKHQLCFWHALRALKQRLAKKKETPAIYDAETARKEFSFIDTAFIPLGQRVDGSAAQVCIKLTAIQIFKFTYCVIRPLLLLRSHCLVYGF